MDLWWLSEEDVKGVQSVRPSLKLSPNRRVLVYVQMAIWGLADGLIGALPGDECICRVSGDSLDSWWLSEEDVKGVQSVRPSLKLSPNCRVLVYVQMAILGLADGLIGALPGDERKKKD